MQRSESIDSLVTSLVKAQGNFKTVPKTKTAKVPTKSGGEYSYKYADLADVLSMAVPVLSAEGLAFSQPHSMVDGKLRVRSMLLHTSGQWIASDGIEISEEGTPQQFGAESTYWRRYDGCSLLGIAPDEDTDAQQAGNRSRKQTAPPPQLAHPKNPPNNHLEGNILIVRVDQVLEKKTEKGRDYVALTFAPTGKRGIAFCFHAHLFALLKTTGGKQCQFEVEESNGNLAITTVLDINGQEYRDGKPYNPDAEPDMASATASPEITDADLPTELFS